MAKKPKTTKANEKAKPKARPKRRKSWSKAWAKATKPRARMGRPLIMGGPLGDLAVAMGGRTALCEYLGIDQKTIHRWWRGEELPRKPVRMLLAIVAQEHGIEPPYGIEDDCATPKWIGAERAH